MRESQPGIVIVLTATWVVTIGCSGSAPREIEKTAKVVSSRGSVVWQATPTLSLLAYFLSFAIAVILRDNLKRADRPARLESGSRISRAAGPSGHSARTACVVVTIADTRLSSLKWALVRHKPALGDAPSTMSTRTPVAFSSGKNICSSSTSSEM